jgi:hypothetical protein
MTKGERGLMLLNVIELGRGGSPNRLGGLAILVDP